MFIHPYDEILTRVLEFILAAAIVIGLQSLYLLGKDRQLAKAWSLTVPLGMLVALPISLLGGACSLSLIGLSPWPEEKIFQMCVWGSPIWISATVIGLIQTRLLDEDIRPAYLVIAFVSSLALSLLGGALTLFPFQIIGEAIIPGIVLVYGLATSIVLFVYYR